MNMGLDRRGFLKLSALTGTAMVAAAALPKFSMASVRKVSLAECLAMTPQDMAKSSKLVMDSWDYIRVGVSTIRDKEIRDKVMGMIENPAPTFVKNMADEASKKAAYDKLTSAGLIKDVAFEAFLPPTNSPDRSPQPFLSAPGSGYGSHHAYPGGVITHTALNLKVSLALHDGYKDIYDFEMDRDAVVASQVLHDLHKPWVFQWEASNASRTELPLAGTGEHHCYSVAESIYRGLPADICVAQACAHNHPGSDKDEEGPLSWLKAAAVLAGVDPVKHGLLDASEKTLPLPRKMEGFICHLGDHDWVLTVPAAKWTIPVMAEIAGEKYGLQMPGDPKNVTPEEAEHVKKFNALRNYVFAQATIMTLYNVYSTKGKEALTDMVTSIVIPA
jgi:hypothetical protein